MKDKEFLSGWGFFVLTDLYQACGSVTITKTNALEWNIVFRVQDVH